MRAWVRGRSAMWAATGALAWVVGVAPPVVGQEAGLLERPARLEVQGVSIASALSALQRSSGVSLAFSPDLLPAGRAVTCRCGEVAVRVALDRLLAGTGLTYVERRRQVLITRANAVAPVVRDGTLTGVVVEAEGGRPVPDAEVALTRGGRSVLTGGDGRFALPNAGAGAKEVRVSALGYTERIMAVDASGVGDVRVELVRTPIPLDEIVISPGSFGVLETTPTVSGLAVSREDIEATPQLGDDVFRTLKRLPGVSTDDISTRLNIRGGTDRDLLVRLDGLELYEPYHLRDLDGALGIVDVQSLGGIDLITGGFPVEYGDKTAGVFDMHTRRPPPDGTRTTIGLSLSSVGVNSQGSFADGKGQWVAAVRRGFLQYILAVGGVSDDIKPRFWDALGRVQYLVSPRNVVSAEILVAGDQMGWLDGQSRVDSDWANRYGWLTWNATPVDGLRVETVLSVGSLSRDRVGGSEGGNGAFTPLEAAVDDVSDFTFTGVQQNWSVGLTDDLLLKAGVDLRRGHGSYDYASSAKRYAVDAADVLITRTDSIDVVERVHGNDVGLYGALRGRIGSALTWEGGVRWDRQSYTGEGRLGPRALLRWDASRRTSVRASWGRYVESQGLQDLRVQDGEHAYNPAEHADQVAVGVGRDFGGGVTARVEVYARSMRDPLPTYVNLAREVNPIEEVQTDRRRIAPEEGRARGLEFIVSRDGTGALSWAGSYALAQAEDRIGGVWVPRTLDQRHTLTFQGAYRLGRAWQFSGVWHYHTGWPFTEQTLDVDIGTAPDGRTTATVIRRDFGPYNAERLPPYHRLDLRVTRNFEFQRSRLEVFLDVFNAYDRTNLRGYDWGLAKTPDGYTGVRGPGEEQLPIMPTLGLRWVF